MRQHNKWHPKYSLFYSKVFFQSFSAELGALNWDTKPIRSPIAKQTFTNSHECQTPKHDLVLACNFARFS